MHDRPTPRELVEAVREFLGTEIVPLLDDHRIKFRTIVALNALGIAERELAATQAPVSDAAERELARAIRAGEPPEDAVAILKELVAAKLRVTNPPYLEKFE